LADLNFGRGVANNPTSGVLTGVDFTITRTDGVTFGIDVAGAETIAVILARINTNAVNLASGVPLVARLAASGNGIELVDNSGGAGTLTVSRTEQSNAAIDLGLIPAGEESAEGTAVGGSDVLTGSDTNPQETDGLFTALLRLYQGLQANDDNEIRRAVEILDAQVLNLNFARGELGARQQGLEALQERLDGEAIELKTSVSDLYDADLVETISNVTSRQAAFEASLMAAAQTLQLSLLDYL
jgi:flagellin-like hook-associated protein FlgL